MSHYVQLPTAPADAWDSAISALLGALVGGVAVLMGARMEARSARKLAREERVDDAVDEVLQDLWDVMALQCEELAQPTSELLPNMTPLQRVSRLSSLTVRSERALSRVVHDYGNSFNPAAPIRDSRLRAAALSGALHLWQRNPKEFRKRDWHLSDYEVELAYDFAERLTVHLEFSTDPLVADERPG